MKISAKVRQAGNYTLYDVMLHSAEGKEPFLTVKDCKVIDGTNGRFVSFPARKDNKDKWWPMLYASDAFQVECIKAMDAAAPRDTRTLAERKKPTPIDMPDDIPPF